MRGMQILIAVFLFVGLTSNGLVYGQESCESYCKRWQREKDLPRQGYVDCLRRCKEAPQAERKRQEARCDSIIEVLQNARYRGSYDRSAFDDIWQLADRLNASSEARALMAHYFRSGSSYALWKLQKLCENGEL